MLYFSHINSFYHSIYRSCNAFVEYEFLEFTKFPSHEYTPLTIVNYIVFSFFRFQPMRWFIPFVAGWT